jgi:hypothetical protein
LQNRVLADKYNEKLKLKLFEIFDDEISKFYESASSAYEKSRDPKVFGDLENSIEDSIGFRRNVSVNSATEKLDEIRRKLSVHASNSVDLGPML